MLTENELLLKMYKAIYKYGIPPTQSAKLERFNILVKSVGIGKLLYGQKCPLCGEEVDFTKFTEDLDFDEFILSGMCKKCQDNFFV